MDTILDPVIQGYIDRAKEAQEAGHYQDVLDICTEAEEKKIIHPRLIVGESSALAILKRYREAQELLERSVEEYPDEPDLHYTLGLIYPLRGRWESGRREAKRALELLPDVSPDEMEERLSVIKGGSLLILRRSREARRFLEHEVARFPESTYLHYLLAGAYLKRWHWIKALKQTEWLSGKQKNHIRIKVALRLVALGLILTAIILTVVTSMKPVETGKKSNVEWNSATTRGVGSGGYFLNGRTVNGKLRLSVAPGNIPKLPAEMPVYTVRKDFTEAQVKQLARSFGMRGKFKMGDSGNPEMLDHGADFTYFGGGSFSFDSRGGHVSLQVQ